MTTTTGRDTRHAAPPSTNWRSYAACAQVGGDAFFPEGSKREIAEQTTAAKRVCRRCPVREQRLLDLGEPVGVMAMELRTNAQTVKKVLARLEEEKAEEVRAA